LGESPNKYKAAVAKSNHFSKKGTTIETQIASQNRGSSLLFETKGIDIYSSRSHLEGGPPETPAFTSLSGYDGLTAGHGVIVRLDCTRNLRLLAHEFVHVAQYERWEGKDSCKNTFNKSPHTDTPFKLEAEAKAVKACRAAGVHPF
jgi:hypothetical protein